jgi:hypothetical protein
MIKMNRIMMNRIQIKNRENIIINNKWNNWYNLKEKRRNKDFLMINNNNKVLIIIISKMNKKIYRDKDHKDFIQARIKINSQWNKWNNRKRK